MNIYARRDGRGRGSTAAARAFYAGALRGLHVAGPHRRHRWDSWRRLQSVPRSGTGARLVEAHIGVVQDEHPVISLFDGARRVEGLHTSVGPGPGGPRVPVPGVVPPHLHPGTRDVPHLERERASCVAVGEEVRVATGGQDPVVAPAGVAVHDGRVVDAAVVRAGQHQVLQVLELTGAGIVQRLVPVLANAIPVHRT